ncbi:hypothetical protein CHS0354_010612 [Potamilus streckersoni]|uniref:Uncharacterized protein n=1 Tax=Potamilus streckersoni TaxID=2493646 RepID=A0AAE0SFX5_9BIVA|nr:hypothetical protein CHS0354_010612 [Potamilus streckersoni]
MVGSVDVVRMGCVDVVRLGSVDVVRVGFCRCCQVVSEDVVRMGSVNVVRMGFCRCQVGSVDVVRVDSVDVIRDEDMISKEFMSWRKRRLEGYKIIKRKGLNGYWKTKFDAEFKRGRKYARLQECSSRHETYLKQYIHKRKRGVLEI